jgi:hypothetical protein
LVVNTVVDMAVGMAVEKAVGAVTVRGATTRVTGRRAMAAVTVAVTGTAATEAMATTATDSVSERACQVACLVGLHVAREPLVNVILLNLVERATDGVHDGRLRGVIQCYRVIRAPIRCVFRDRINEAEMLLAEMRECACFSDLPSTRHMVLQCDV